MPTIDQLAPAPAASDLDAFPASQSGTVRRVTRLQILAGTQPQLTIPSTTLLGRCSAGMGPPEVITVGAGLTLIAGHLAAPPAPISLAGVSASLGLVTPAGTKTARTLADLFADAVTAEDFGAVGDGITDDTAAINAAIATLRPVHLMPRCYATSGQWTIPVAATLIGTRGQTTIRRIAQTGGAWISIQGPAFHAHGISFDANGTAVPLESWGLLVTPACLASRFDACTFANASGAVLGNGLTIQTSDPVLCSHSVDGCEASGNAAHGIWVQAIEGLRIANTSAHDNVGYGICADFNDPGFATALRLATITQNRCWANARGISIGNFNSTNRQPPTWGNANPDAIGVLVQANTCHDNVIYGIAVSGRSINVDANVLSNNGSAANGGAGILANCTSSRVAGNIIVGASQYGIDSGGSIALDIVSNHISGAVVGINPGGSTDVRVTANYLAGNRWAVTVYNVETDGRGQNFGLATTNLTIAENTILLADGDCGIALIDAPQAVAVFRNSFLGSGTATMAQCLYAHTDSVVIEGNRWNNAARLFANPVAVNGLQTVQLPVIADEVMISVALGGVQAMMTPHQLLTLGQIGFVKVVGGGSGYTKASVTITGSGAGAAASAYVSGGKVIGISLDAPGGGYGSPGATASVVIGGDGVGAAATACVGLPVLEGRRVRVACNTAVRFARNGSNPFQENWTLADMTVPANATVTFTGTFGGWRADSVPLADYILPPGDGSLVVRTMGSADLTLHPAGAGHLRLATDRDPTGYIAATGHGSPEGVVTAPPGSDYRNLDGGVAQTLWIKRTGTDSHGWYAIA